LVAQQGIQDQAIAIYTDLYRSHKTEMQDSSVNGFKNGGH